MGMTSKSKSAVTLLVPSNYNSAKKNKKANFTAKKKHIQSVHVDTWMHSNDKYLKYTPQKGLNSLNHRNTSSSIQIRALKR